jgi:hypothetical protein
MPTFSEEGAPADSPITGWKWRPLSVCPSAYPIPENLAFGSPFTLNFGLYAGPVLWLARTVHLRENPKKEMRGAGL